MTKSIYKFLIHLLRSSTCTCFEQYLAHQKLVVLNFRSICGVLQELRVQHVWLQLYGVQIVYDLNAEIKYIYIYFFFVRVCVCVSLTVHRSKTSDNDQINTQIFNTFITILYTYMFRAISCSSSGGQIVLTQHLVSSLSVSDLRCTG